MEMVEEKKVIVFVRDEISELILLVATEKGIACPYQNETSEKRTSELETPCTNKVFILSNVTIWRRIGLWLQKNVLKCDGLEEIGFE